jgi:hypothetical protein
VGYLPQLISKKQVLLRFLDRHTRDIPSCRWTFAVSMSCIVTAGRGLKAAASAASAAFLMKARFIAALAALAAAFLLLPHS